MGCELLQQSGNLYYWREGVDEVDFIYQYRQRIYAIEVKSGRNKSAKGLQAFCEKEPSALRVILTPDNFSAFSANPTEFLKQIAI